MTGLLHENVKIWHAVSAVVPSSLTPPYVSLKNFDWLTVILLCKNATATGGAITLKQASVVAGTDEKALAFTKAYRNLDNAAALGANLAEFAVSNNTFTTDSTNSKNLIYQIPVDPASLDVAGGFDCVRVGVADMTGVTVSVLYALSRGRYGAVGIDPLTD